MIYALDPGSEVSAVVGYDPAAKRIGEHWTLPNAEVLQFCLARPVYGSGILVVEEFQSYGMAVGMEVFRTVWWSGRFHQAWPNHDTHAFQLSRREVKLHLCHSARATDANVRQAIQDRFGPTKAAAVGVKATPGPLFGIKSHEYSALGVGLTWADLKFQNSGVQRLA
jgi:hypothetical protein